MNQPPPPVSPQNRRPRLTTHVVTEATARQRCREFLEQGHRLGARRPKGRSLYQVVCRDDVWVGVILWTGSCWHLKARDQWIGCALALIRTILQSLVRWVGRDGLPTVFEDVADNLSLGLGWLHQRHFHR